MKFRNNKFVLIGLFIILAILTVFYLTYKPKPTVNSIVYDISIQKIAYNFPQLNVTFFFNESTMWLEKVEIWRSNQKTDEIEVTPTKFEQRDRLTLSLTINEYIPSGEKIELGLWFRKWLDVDHAPYEPYRMMLEILLP